MASWRRTSATDAGHGDGQNRPRQHPPPLEAVPDDDAITRAIADATATVREAHTTMSELRADVERLTVANDALRRENDTLRQDAAHWREYRHQRSQQQRQSSLAVLREETDKLKQVVTP